MKQFIINEQQVQALVNFLATCPYQSVAKGIEELMRLPVLSDDMVSNLTPKIEKDKKK